MLSCDEKDSRGEAKRAQTEEEESDGDKNIYLIVALSQPLRGNIFFCCDEK